MSQSLIVPSRIVNLTQHVATPQQLEAGVVELFDGARRKLLDYITFDTPPSAEEIVRRGRAIARLVAGEPAAMIGGAPFLMSSLEMALRDNGVLPLYAFSVRASDDEPRADGSVRKVAVFRHLGFVAPPQAR